MSWQCLGNRAPRPLRRPSAGGRRPLIARNTRRVVNCYMSEVYGTRILRRGGQRATAALILVFLYLG